MTSSEGPPIIAIQCNDRTAYGASKGTDNQVEWDFLVGTVNATPTELQKAFGQPQIIGPWPGQVWLVAVDWDLETHGVAGRTHGLNLVGQDGAWTVEVDL